MKFIREEGLPYPQPWEFVINEVFRNKRNGIFIDVGAYDGNTVSNTLYMEDQLGWKGICIEPNPESFENLIINRNTSCLNIGISDVESILKFYKVKGYAEMLSGFVDYLSEGHIKRIHEEISKNGGSFDIIDVPVKKLSSILIDNKIEKIDYLSIDTEGNEFRVIKSINFNSVDVSVISAENNDNSDEVMGFLNSFGFSRINKICGDDIYINKNIRL
jgi:hypothetical protein